MLVRTRTKKMFIDSMHSKYTKKHHKNKETTKQPEQFGASEGPKRGIAITIIGRNWATAL